MGSCKFKYYSITTTTQLICAHGGYYTCRDRYNPGNKQLSFLHFTFVPLYKCMCFNVFCFCLCDFNMFFRYAVTSLSLRICYVYRVIRSAYRCSIFSVVFLQIVVCSFVLFCWSLGCLLVFIVRILITSLVSPSSFRRRTGITI